MDTNVQTPLSLRDLQLWLRWIIVDPRGVVPALQNPTPGNPTHPDRYVEPKPSARTLIDDSTKTGFETRLSIYAEGYFSRILEVIEGDFPTTKLVLGEDEFTRLVAEYLKDFPSSETNIGEVAKFLPVFVKNYPILEAFPYLKDLITLEWGIVESFYAKDQEPGSLDVSKISSDDWPNIAFKLASSVRLFEFQWTVEHLWHCRKNQNSPDTLKILKKIPSFTFLFHVNGDAFVLSVSKLEFDVLKMLFAGLTLGKITEKIDQKVGFENHLSEWFAKWTSFGLLKEAHFKHEEPL